MNGKITDLVVNLNFVTFVVPAEHTPPSKEELASIAKTMGGRAVSTVVENYLSASSDRLTKCGIRAGCVLKLKGGGHLLVGHVSENLGYVDDTPFVSLDEIESIAYLY